jgi:hypothetical protein
VRFVLYLVQYTRYRRIFIFMVYVFAIGPTLVGYGLEGALKFGFYETFKKVLVHATPSTFVNLLLASVVAGAVASIVLVRWFVCLFVCFL